MSDASLPEPSMVAPLLQQLREVLQAQPVNEAEALNLLKQLKHTPQGSAWLCVVDSLPSLARNTAHPSILHEALATLAYLKAQSAYSLFAEVAIGSAIVAAFVQPAPTPSHAERLTRCRVQAIRQLGLLGNAQAMQPLMTLLNDRTLNYRLRLEAAEALGRLGDHQAIDSLLSIARDDKEPSLYLRESAVKALGMLGDIRALDPLLELFEAKRGVKQKFAFVMEQLVSAIHHLATPHDQKVLASLQTALRDASPTLRLSAVEAIGDLGDEHHVPMLQERLFDDNTDVAHAALSAIYKLSGTPGVLRQWQNERLPQFLREEIQLFLVSQGELALEADALELERDAHNQADPTTDELT
jgi:HEAT repeat protein